MLGWSLGFLILAIIAAFLGFRGIASGASEVARACFAFFAAAFVASLVWPLAMGRRSSPPV